MKRINLFLLTASLLLLAACSSEKAEESKTVPAPAASGPAAPAVDPATAATIAGKAIFSGEKPKRMPISMDAVPNCARQHEKPMLSEEAIVGAGGALANVLVYVKSGLPAGNWPVPSTPVDLDQKGCMYSPHVLGLMAGQNLAISNSDPTNHNVHPMPRVNREWNESEPPQSPPKLKSFDKPEIGILFKCNVHPWMRAYVSVLANPFFAVTAEDGTFSIKGLPPGDYTLEAWHEKFGVQEIKVKVEAKESKTANFTFKG
jgi:plastocyanin